MSTYWQDEPATEQQLRRLKELGFAVANPLTLTEAARLIRQYQKSPLRPGEPAKGEVSLQKVPGRAVTPSAPIPAAVPPQPGKTLAAASRQLLNLRAADISESTRMQAAGLRATAEKARAVMAATPDAPNVRADFTVATARRQEFWVDTCRDSREMQIGSVQVFELYQNYGCRFFPPTREQAQIIFDALDSALPTWDRDHPELFYQTLELNFPDLVRR